MGPIRRWLIYLFGALVGGALLAPWVYVLIQSAAASWPAFEWLAGHPFRRYVNRCLLILALGGLVWARRELGLGPGREWGWSVRGERPHWGLPVWGFGLGLGAMGVALGVELVWGTLTWSPSGDVGAWGHLLLVAGMSAGGVALLEETLFRGFLFRTARREHGWVGAAWFSSLLYAWAHFLTKVDWRGPVDWSSGLRVLAGSMNQFLAWDALVPGFLVLVIAGLVLAMACERGAGLWLPAGLHAGWVLGRKLTDGLTQTGPAAGAPVGAWTGCGLLLLTAWLIQRRLPGEDPGPAANPTRDAPTGEELA